MKYAKYTDAELLELGIKRVDDYGESCWDRGSYIYSCASCGRPTRRASVILSRPVYCSICSTDAMEKRKMAREQAKRNEIEINSIDTTDINKKIRFQKAADKMSKLAGYEPAIQKAKLAYNKYDSVPEAIAAIVLLHCGYRVIAQQPVSDYTVDFVLPDKKLAIEVDGSIYHADAAKEEIRDISLKHNLGDGWEILHIPAESLAKRPKTFENLIKRKVNSMSAK